MPWLVDPAAAIATVLAELDVHRNEPVLVTLPDGPGFAESFAGAVHQDALPLVASPLLCCASAYFRASLRAAELRQRAIVNRRVLTGRVAFADDSLMMIIARLAGA